MASYVKRWGPVLSPSAEPGRQAEQQADTGYEASASRQPRSARQGEQPRQSHDGRNRMQYGPDEYRYQHQYRERDPRDAPPDPQQQHEPDDRDRHIEQVQQ